MSVPLEGLDDVRIGADLVAIAAQIRNIGMQHGKGFSLLVVPTAEGQSTATLAAGLAIALRQLDGRPVLVVEFSNGRTSSSASHTLIPAYETALVSTMTRDTLFEEKQMLHFVKATLCNPGADPVASASSDAFRSFLKAAEQRFGYVLIEAPCPRSSMESVLIAPWCDGILLTVSKSKSKMSDVRRVAALMQRVKARIIGYVYDLSPAPARY
jgi:Mrp family chromosome partitioning ATPase